MYTFVHLIPQSHPTTGPVRLLSPVRFLARKAEWSTRRNFTQVLFPWSHQATGPVWLDTAVYLWFGWIIRRTPRVPHAIPVRASWGPRTGIFNVFHILRDPYGHIRKLTKPELAKILHGCRIWPYRVLTGCSVWAVHRLFTISKPIRGPQGYNACIKTLRAP